MGLVVRCGPLIERLVEESSVSLGVSRVKELVEESCSSCFGVFFIVGSESGRRWFVPCSVH